jgi:hypothetical protein
MHIKLNERQLNIRLAPDDAARVDALAAHYGIKPASLMRLLIKRASDALPAPTATAQQPGTSPATTGARNPDGRPR